MLFGLALEVRNLVVVLKGAGVPEVNGEYRFDRTLNGAGCYSRTDLYNNNEVKFVVAKIGRGTHTFWVIYCTDENKDVTVRNTSLYFSYDEIIYDTPTKKEYFQFNGVSRPAPHVTFKTPQDDATVLSSELGNERTKENNTIDFILYNDDSLKDFTITYKGEVMKAHKIVLGSISFYFQRMFSHEWKEKDSCELTDLENISTAEFRAFLEYIYTRAKHLLADHGWAIWDLCDYFDVLTSIQEQVSQVLSDSLTCQNIGKLMKILRHLSNTASPENQQLQEKFVSFVVENSVQLADEGFPFHEIEPYLLNLIFKNNRKRALPK
jgi:hypothetical protein